MENIEEYIKKAEEFKQNGDYTIAIKMYCKALSVNSEAKQAVSGISELYGAFAEHNKDILRECIRAAEVLYEKDKKDEAELLASSMLKLHEDATLYSLAGEICFTNDKTDEAIRYYSHAINTNNKESTYYFKLAIAFSVKGFFKEAENCYLKALGLNPDNNIYRYALAYLYFTGNKIAEAEKTVDLILLDEPDNPKANALKILINLSNNDLFEAGKIVKKYENKSINDDYLMYAFGMYYSKLNLWEKTIEYINKASALNNKATEYKFELAQYYYKQKNYDDCEFLCDEIIKINNKYLPAYILKSELLIDTKRLSEAEDYLKKTTELDINTAEIYYLTGKIKYITGKYKEAEDNFKTAISISPDNAVYYEMTALSYYAEDEYETACLYFKEAAATDISVAKYRLMAAKCYAKLNDTENAIYEFSLMMRLEPDNIEYIKEYVEFLCSVGQKRNAKNILKKAQKTVEDKSDKEKIKEMLKNI